MTRDWMLHAACGKPGQDPNIFVPDYKSQSKETIAKNTLAAKRICWNQCPVRVHCLLYAYETKEQSGIMGGFTPAERKSRRK